MQLAALVKAQHTAAYARHVMLMGTQKRLGAQSSIFRATQHELYERQLFRLIGQLIDPFPGDYLSPL